MVALRGARMAPMATWIIKDQQKRLCILYRSVKLPGEEETESSVIIETIFMSVTTGHAGGQGREA